MVSQTIRPRCKSNSAHSHTVLIHAAEQYPSLALVPAKTRGSSTHHNITELCPGACSTFAPAAAALAASTCSGTAQDVSCVTQQRSSHGPVFAGKDVMWKLSSQHARLQSHMQARWLLPWMIPQLTPWVQAPMPAGSALQNPQQQDTMWAHSLSLHAVAWLPVADNPVTDCPGRLPLKSQQGRCGAHGPWCRH